MNSLIFVWKSVNDKFVEVMETKETAETAGIADFRGFIAVIEGFQEFFAKKVLAPFEVLSCPSESFLSAKFEQLKSQLPKSQLTTFKKAKLV